MTHPVPRQIRRAREEVIQIGSREAEVLCERFSPHLMTARGQHGLSGVPASPTKGDRASLASKGMEACGVGPS